MPPRNVTGHADFPAMPSGAHTGLSLISFVPACGLDSNLQPDMCSTVHLMLQRSSCKAGMSCLMPWCLVYLSSCPV
jgi:hypothetical protein